SNQTGVDVAYALIENSSLSYNQIGGTSNQWEENTFRNCIINYNSIKGIEIDIPYGLNQDGILRNIIDSNSVGIKIGGSSNSGGSIYCNKICNNISYDLQLNTT